MSIPNEGDSDMLLSIIMPVYNMDWILEQTLYSFCEQLNYHRFNGSIELIVINDCSTDGTKRILNNYANKYKDIKAYTLGKRVTTGQARNIGISKADGEYIAFLDGDDIMSLKTAMTACERLEADKGAEMLIAQYCDFMETGEQGEPRGLLSTQESLLVDTTSSHLFYVTNSACWNKVLRKSFIEENNLRFTDCNNGEDMAFTLSALCKARKVLLLHDVLITYLPPAQNVHSNAQKVGTGKQWLGILDSLEHVFNTIMESPNIEAEVKRGLLGCLTNIALDNLGNAKKGIRDTEELSEFNGLSFNLLSKCQKAHKKLTQGQGIGEK